MRSSTTSTRTAAMLKLRSTKNTTSRSSLAATTIINTGTVEVYDDNDNNNNSNEDNNNKRMHPAASLSLSLSSSLSRISWNQWWVRQKQKQQQQQNQLSKLPHWLVPSCLLAGTAVTYSKILVAQQQRAAVGMMTTKTLLLPTSVAAMNSSSSSWSPTATLCMLLLATQYAILPKLSKRYVRKESSKVQIAFTEEIVKSMLAGSLFVFTNSYSTIQQIFIDWRFIPSFTLAGLPAVLYAIQGVLQYQSHHYLDSVTYNGLQQMKTLSAAFFCYILLHKTQSFNQLCALLLLTGSAFLFQSTPSQPSTTKETDKLDNSVESTKQHQQQEENNSNRGIQRFWKGVVPCVSATLISGFAGTLSQYGLQRQRNTVGGVGGGGTPISSMITDPYFYALEVSVYSAITLVGMPYLDWIFKGGRKVPNKPDTAVMNVKQNESNQLVTTETKTQKTKTKEDKEDWYFLIPTLCKAVGGVLTVLVHQYAGTVSKGFALTFGLVLSACFESAISGSNMTLSQIVGTIVVLMATWLHQI